MSGNDSLIEFPCDFPIKAMGLAEDNFDLLVVSLIRNHINDINEGAVKTKPSRNGKYLSVTVTITAQSQQQLDDIYRSLSAHERVMVTF